MEIQHYTLEETPMARTKKEPDLKAAVMKRYEELLKRRDEIDVELKGLKTFLKSVGAVRAPRRGLKTNAPSRKGSATEAILSAVGKAKEGITIDQIMKSTRLGRQTVNGVLNRMKKIGKAKALKRGVYTLV
jgi:transposase